MKSLLRLGVCLMALSPFVARSATRPALSPSLPLHQLEKDPRAAWAVIYLLNTAMAAEFEAVRGASEPAGREVLFQSSAGAALRARMRFAQREAKNKAQTLPDGTGGADGQEAKEASPGEIASSFQDEAMQKAWKDLSVLYSAPMPTCPLTKDDVELYADHQASLLRSGAGNSGISLKSLMEPLASWSADKRRCLALVLMGMLPRIKDEPAYEPIHLLVALTSTEFARDLALRALLATRYLQLGQYPESLRALVELTDVEASFRLPYELVQRVFGLKQRGPGAVALQGL